MVPTAARKADALTPSPANGAGWLGDSMDVIAADILALQRTVIE
jgi:hypothetical protein